MHVESGLRVIRSIAEDVAAPAAADVDAHARLPSEALSELRRHGLLASSLPTVHGGAGWQVDALARAAMILGGACSATGMIWGMHHSQVAALVAHAPESSSWTNELERLAQENGLVASVASEMGSGGNLVATEALVRETDGRYEVVKHAATVSYGAAADAYLISCPPPASPAGGEPVTILARADECRVEATGTWRPLGMRGTASPPMTVTATVDAWRALRDPFAVVLDHTMAPVAHILWASCWIGAAGKAVQTAREYLRAERGHIAARGATLARASAAVGTARALVDRAVAVRESEAPGSLLARQSYNALKVEVSQLVVRAALDALEITGINGYLEDSRWSVARQVRDLLSAPLMVSNLRLIAGGVETELLRGRHGVDG